MRSRRSSFLRLGVLLTLAALFTAAFWPTDVNGETGVPQEAADCRVKMERLKKAIARGDAVHASFSESELNAHLARLLTVNRTTLEGSGLQVGIDDLRIHATGEEATFFVGARLVGIPVVVAFHLDSRGGSGRRLPVRVRSAQLGHLPLLPPFEILAVHQLEYLLSGLTYERQIVENLSEVEIGHGELGVATPARNTA